MTVSAITSDYGIFAANANASSGTSTTSADSDLFLQLMVAQLKYQDPMNPTDSSTMLTQNATFTEVQSINEMTEEMGMLLSAQLASGAASLVGQNVSWIGSDGTVQSGTVSGATFTSSGPMLVVGDQEIAYSSVAAVGDVSGATTDSTDSTNS